MRNQIKNIMLTMIITLFATNSFAEGEESGVYIEAGIAPLNISYSNYSYSIGSTYVVYAGYNLNKNLAIEVMTATSSTADYSTTLSFGGIFIKPKLPINDTFELFGRVGANRLTLSTSYGGSVSQTYTAYGGGVTVYTTGDKKQYLTVDYMQWAANNGYTLSGPSVTYGYKF